MVTEAQKVQIFIYFGFFFSSWSSQQHGLCRAQNAIHISEVLRTAQERDQELQKIAQSGKYAAGEDP